MTPRLHSALRSFLLALLLLLAGGCSGDEPAANGATTPDADVLGVLGVGAAPGGAAPKSGRTEAGATPADKAREDRTPPEAAPAGQSLKVEVSAPRFASDKQAPAPTVSATPGGALDY